MFIFRVFEPWVGVEEDFATGSAQVCSSLKIALHSIYIFLVCCCSILGYGLQSI